MLWNTHIVGLNHGGCRDRRQVCRLGLSHDPSLRIVIDPAAIVQKFKSRGGLYKVRWEATASRHQSDSHPCVYSHPMTLWSVYTDLTRAANPCMSSEVHGTSKRLVPATKAHASTQQRIGKAMHEEPRQITLSKQYQPLQLYGATLHPRTLLESHRWQCNDE